MTFDQKLKNELFLPLPGIDSQLKMAPENRNIHFDGGLKQNAAVAIIINSSSENKKEIILIKRPEYDGPHSGQVSFPGGKEEPGDKSLIVTAIRETYEEIGIQLSEDNYVGELSPLFIPISRFMVFPFVFTQYSSEDLIIDPNEVDYVVSFQLKKLTDMNLIKSTQLQIGKETLSVPYFAIKSEIVWGATAMILSEFIEILHRIQRKNPD